MNYAEFLEQQLKIETERLLMDTGCDERQGELLENLMRAAATLVKERRERAELSKVEDPFQEVLERRG